MIGIVEDWERYYQQAFRCCKPGGYVEDLTNGVVLDSDDGTVKEGGALHQWGKVFHEGGRKLGRTFKVIELGLHKKAMEKAGFVDIVIDDYKVPIGPWPEDKNGTNWVPGPRLLWSRILKDMSTTSGDSCWAGLQKRSANTALL